MAASLPFWDRYNTDPAFAEAVDEEARSIAESTAWNTRAAQSPGPCPRCGTQVARVLETRAGAADRWQAGVWEPGHAAVRHTARRCAWLHANPGLARTA